MKKSAAENPFIPFTPAEVQGLLSWYMGARRDLPWRETSDPYRIWLSEIMLQQTRVEAVKGYYARFLAALPTIADLASAPEEQLLKLWEGLGYYSRARNLQKAAQQIVREHGGAFPADYEAIRALPGIGSYTAGAIASIAFGIPAPAVDGNVLRVLARYAATEREITDPAVKSAAEELLRPLIPEGAAGDFNQSLIELGATVCAPNAAPACERCPLRDNCRAAKTDDPTAYPKKKAKAARRIVPLTVLLLTDEGGEVLRYLIRRRPNKGLLAGLFEFPNLPGTLSPEEALTAAESFGFAPESVQPLPPATHIFTHVEWHMTLFELHGRWERLLPDSGLLAVTGAELGKIYAVPSAFSAIMKIIENR